MRISDIRDIRLYNQHIMHPRFNEPGDIVRWLGAVQAQDYLGSLWAIGLRLKSSNEAAIEKAIESREIVRSWPMRGTLHFVHSEDLRWMLKFLTPRVIKRSAGLYRDAELDNKIFAKSGKLLTKHLRQEQQLTRNEIYAILERAGISTVGQRGLYILGHLAQTGLICFGARKGKQQTFVLFDEWIPVSKIPRKEEALAALALTYFQSHGPATIHDFSWWSGLTIAEVKSAMAPVRQQLESEILDDRNYYMCPTNRKIKASHQISLLPNYDEYFVAYKDRSAAFDLKIAQRFKQLGNGIFTSPVVINGLMAGCWKRSFVKDKVLIETNIFSTFTKASGDSIESTSRKFGKFLKKAVLLSQRNA